MTNTHAERYQQITEILARHGLGFLVGAAGLQRWVPFERGLLGHDQRAEPYPNPEHLRLALEQLGPVFVKLGQVLSTRADLLPEPGATVPVAGLDPAGAWADHHGPDRGRARRRPVGGVGRLR